MAGLRKHKPVPENIMYLSNPQYSICEVLREIYHKTDDEEIKLKCRIATAMAKAMSYKLSEYHEKGDAWKSGFWQSKAEIEGEG